MAIVPIMNIVAIKIETAFAIATIETATVTASAIVATDHQTIRDDVSFEACALATIELGRKTRLFSFAPTHSESISVGSCKSRSDTRMSTDKRSSNAKDLTRMALT